MSSADMPLRALFFRLQATVERIVDLVTNTESGGLRTKTYASKAALLAADSTEFDIAYTSNYNTGDGVIGLWFKTSDENLLPNGMDILQLNDGTVVLRQYARENDGSSVSAPSGSAYTVSVPVAFPTLTDFLNSTLNSHLCLFKDANGQMGIWLLDETNDETGTQNVDWAKNTSNTYYRRQ